MQSNENHLLTVDEVADATRVSVKTIRRAVKRGDLPAVRLGRTLRVRPCDLAAYVERHTYAEATASETSNER